MMNRYQMKKLLEKFNEANRELDSLRDEHARLKSALLCVTPSYGGDSGSGGPKDKIGENVPELVDLRETVVDEVRQYAAIRDVVKAIVRRVSYHDPVKGQCLHYRYINGWSPAKTAREMCYVTATERGIHRDALDLACRVASDMGVDETSSFFIGVPVI
ncbi:MAG: hypothetical protein IJW29_06405 [Clostridia bacterium]|nr:hypothetical protein [Clostridia bacterium]